MTTILTKTSTTSMLAAYGIHHLSPTMLRMWLECPAKFYARYVLGLQPRTTGKMYTGKVVHHTLAWWYRQRLLRHAPTGEDVLDEFHTAWRHLQDGEDLGIAWRDGRESQRLQEAAGAALSVYTQEYRGEVPVATELRLQEPLVNSTEGSGDEGHGGIPVLGILDLVVESTGGTGGTGGPGGTGLRIVDVKTSQRTAASGALALQHRLQLGCYCWLLRRAAIRDVRGLEIRQLVLRAHPQVTAACAKTADAEHYFLTVAHAFLDWVGRGGIEHELLARPSFMCSPRCIGWGCCQAHTQKPPWPSPMMA